MRLEVKITNDFQILNVFWVPNGDESDVTTSKILDRNAGLLRKRLTELGLMVRIPHIIFSQENLDFLENSLSRKSRQRVEKVSRLSQPLVLPLRNEVNDKVDSSELIRTFLKKQKAKKEARTRKERKADEEAEDFYAEEARLKSRRAYTTPNRKLSKTEQVEREMRNYHFNLLASSEMRGPGDKRPDKDHAIAYSAPETRTPIDETTTR
ncbi:hypothetical protein QYM36_014237 [Artemia franciscana]|uniref:Uncharacterized protein n=1 Tax=Artemia franciscana TaxID=6661 RepID=A0AA88HJ92_ARTSF|nr:hypothetical protein QYM36_014237 [Artemia franciscana]